MLRISREGISEYHTPSSQRAQLAAVEDNFLEPSEMLGVDAVKSLGPLQKGASLGLSWLFGGKWACRV